MQLANLVELLLIVHSNMLCVRKRILGEEENTPPDEVGEEEQELDLGKTGENLWQLITMQGATAQYDSVLQFLDESIPKLKKKQQEDMKQNLGSKLYQLS